MQQDQASMVEAFRDSAKAFLGTAATTARLRSLRDGETGFDRAVWKQIAEAGWTSILVPEAQGGLGLGLRELLAVVEEIGRKPLPEPFVAAGVHGTALLCALPPGALRDDLLDSAMAGERIVGVAWQEAAGEIELGVVETRARVDGDRIVLDGTKHWVVPGRGADGWLVVAAGPDGQPGVYWVDAATPGVEAETLPRIDGSPMATLRLRAATVPAAHRLAGGDAARAAVEQANDTARLAQAGELLGIARQAFDTTLDYLKTRVQFGKPIGANQALQHRMVDAWIEVELAAACLRDVLGEHERGAPLAPLASRAKARCADAALHLTRLAVQFHGAIGFTDEYDVGLYWKRALHLAGWLGGAAAHRRRTLRLQPDDAPAADAPQGGPVPPPGTDWVALPEDEFRRAVRAFLHAHYPAPLRHPPRRLHWHEVEDWYRALSRQGWIAPAWPKEHGGMALPPDRLLAFIEEFEDFGAARLPDQGIINLGPVLIRYGTPEQQRRWLPKIIAGEHVWCQGYSEPNAGSDLASLRTEAVADGEHFVVTGQKIWTTLAQDATHIFLLVRTDKAAKKQEGISFLLADLKSPGVTVRPIRNLAGEEEFCEVFLDAVRVPRDHLIGQLNQGWTIAKALLGFERLFVGSPKTCQHALGQLRQLAQGRGLFDDAAFAAEFAALQLDLADLRAVYAGFADIVKRGEALPPTVSLLKIWATETYTRISAKLVDAAAEDGATRGECSAGGLRIDPLAPLLNATVTTIYGGTNEIQRNILARQVLGLPG